MWDRKGLFHHMHLTHSAALTARKAALCSTSLDTQLGAAQRAWGHKEMRIQVGMGPW